jgi:hypothetical protein
VRSKIFIFGLTLRATYSGISLFLSKIQPYARVLSVQGHISSRSSDFCCYMNISEYTQNFHNKSIFSIQTKLCIFTKLLLASYLNICQTIAIHTQWNKMYNLSPEILLLNQYSCFQYICLMTNKNFVLEIYWIILSQNFTIACTRKTTWKILRNLSDNFVKWKYSEVVHGCLSNIYASKLWSSYTTSGNSRTIQLNLSFLLFSLGSHMCSACISKNLLFTKSNSFEMYTWLSTFYWH